LSSRPHHLRIWGLLKALLKNVVTQTRHRLLYSAGWQRARRERDRLVDRLQPRDGGPRASTHRHCQLRRLARCRPVPSTPRSSPSSAPSPGLAPPCRCPPAAEHEVTARERSVSRCAIGAQEQADGVAAKLDDAPRATRGRLDARPPIGVQLPRAASTAAKPSRRELRLKPSS